ncbi:MAG: cardiolipin synthase [Thermoguttaceae bacterium]
MFFQPSMLLTLAHVLVVLAISLRVIMRRPPSGVALAWMFLVAFLPLVGPVFYLLIGERRVGLRRARRIAALRSDYAMLAQRVIDQGLTQVPWDKHRPEARGMDRLGTCLVGIPTVAGSMAKFYSESEQILRAIAEDIDNAHKSVLMEFYIWNEGGAADEVFEALLRAGRRGVSCRVLVDAVGARPWWRGRQPQRLREAGVPVQPALPVSLLQTVVSRNDLRLHRKIVVIDGHVAWTGSMNLVDPLYFKQDAHVGRWVDAMVRLEGSVVAPLAMTMIGDWMLETAESIDAIIASAELGLDGPKGTEDMQVVPSGPGEGDDGLLQMLLAVINSAREELILTTPYFVPDDSMLRALRGAAGRGVGVDMILPERVDSLLTRYASRSYYGDLLDVGVRIHLYQKGLLHTKSITADRRISMFGTVNFDMRSLWLNYEVALFVYGEAFAAQLHALQQSYLQDCRRLDPQQWSKRSRGARFLENSLRLVGPVL